MTPKEKAEELFQFYLPLVSGLGNIDDIKYRCKQCTLITLDECLKILNVWSPFNMSKSSQVIFYEEVKEELEKL